MENKIRNELEILKNIIVNTVPVDRIILFGSYARGTPHVDSDLDIYVVMQENADIREIDAMKLINRAIRDKKTMPVDVVVSKKNDYNQRRFTPSLEQQIAQEGMVLYE